MGDQPARTFPQWDDDFEHGRNTDMRNLMECMRETFDKLLSTIQRCGLPMAEFTDRAIVRILQNRRSLTSPRAYWHPDDGAIVLHLVLSDLLRVTVNERFSLSYVLTTTRNASLDYTI